MGYSVDLRFILWDICQASIIDNENSVKMLVRNRIDENKTRTIPVPRNSRNMYDVSGLYPLQQ